ncbi:putative mitochondrial protein, conserved [Schaereria dolodes]|nr:putative mitochondrial protein, conserved [Schaereria dolodes]
MQRSLSLLLFSTRRSLSTSARLHAIPPFSSGPAPPRLPKEEQDLYEELQRSSTGAFSTPKPTVIVNQSDASSSSSSSDLTPRIKPRVNQSPDLELEASISKSDAEVAAVNVKVQATGDGEELHPDIRRGVKPEFEGERNPKTGEIGGPKNEPLRWGGGVDWSYNGRVTDF